jgi:hypothetical protein
MNPLTAFGPVSRDRLKLAIGIPRSPLSPVTDRDVQVSRDASHYGPNRWRRT